MKIERIETYQVSRPMKTKLKSSIVTIENMEFALVKVEAEGLAGLGVTMSFSRGQTTAIRKLIEDFSASLVGKEVEAVGKLWNEMQVFTQGIGGHTGMPVQAWSAIDTALWDLTAKEAKLPLYKLLGAYRDSVPVYGSGGFLVPIEQVIEEILSFQEQGYGHFKMKVGSNDWREDLRRVEAVRRAVGDGFDIMVDANQKWNVKHTLFMAPRLEELGVRYLEEPLPTQHYEGYRKVCNNTSLCIVAGESQFGLRENFQMMRMGCVDILNPDMPRCGGITQYMQVCAVANAFNIPVYSHTCTEINMHLMAAAPTGGIAEYLPDWGGEIFAEKPDIRNGVMYLNDRPGLGLTFNQETIKKYGV